MSKPKKHAKYSASGSSRWLNCAASVSLSEKVPKPPDNKYSIEGTKSHTVLEAILTGGSFDFEAVVYTADMVKYAREAQKYVRSFETDFSKLLVEEKVSLEFIHPEAFGTSDIAVVDESETLDTMDYKYGAGYAVEVKDNPQLIFYALGFAHRYNYDFKTVRVHIIQPRADHPDGPYRLAELSIKELKQWAFKFEQAIEKAEKKNPKAVPGEWCRWCPAALICPAISTQKLSEARADFEDNTSLTLPSAPQLSKFKDLSTALAAFPYIEMWMKSVRAYAYSELERGRKVPGYKLVPKRGSRQWNNQKQAIRDALKIFPAKKIYESKFISPAKMEKIAGKKWVEKRSSKVSSGQTMVCESDSREENNFDDFDEV